jgi:ParB-like chromosome segregation protein Spo0J
MLKPNKLNPRKITVKQLEKLAASLKDNAEYFEARPIICDGSYTVWAGHSRLKAAKRLGLAEVPVHVIDLPAEKMKEIMIRDNVNNGDWDTNIIADLWDGELDLLADFGLELKVSGYGDSEGSDGSDGSHADGEPTGTGKKSKKVRAKTLVECPHCKKEFEV